MNGSTNFVDGKNYHFYDRLNNDQPPRLYQKLLGQATKDIEIWDPHYTENCKELFCEVEKDGICVEVLTICRYFETRQNMVDFANIILRAIDKKKVPNCRVTVYALNAIGGTNRGRVEWHDRFLIVDENVYIVGASMDSLTSRSPSYGIEQLQDLKDKNLIIGKYIQYRNNIKEDNGVIRGNGYICSVKRGNGI